jgi:agmatine/peptidylarginine deiminase
MEREKKIEKLIQFLNNNNIWMVEKFRVGNVKVIGQIKEDFLRDGLINDITDNEITELVRFLRKTGIILVSAEDTFIDYLVDEDELYSSNLWRKNYPKIDHL